MIVDSIPGGRRALPVPRARGALLWLVVALVGALAAASGLGGALLVLGPVVLGVALGLLGSTLPFLWLIVATAGLGFGWLDEGALEVAGNPINVNGLRWGLVVLAAAAILVRDGVPPLPRQFRGYAAFIGLAVLGALWTPARFEGLKHVLQFAAPLLVALVAIRAIRSRADEDVLRQAFWIGLIVAAVVGLTLGVIGIAPGRALDEGRLLHRGTGPYLLPLLGLALAAWRYRGGAYAAFAIVVFVLGLLTLSRATVLVMLGMTLLATWGKPLRWYVGVALGVALIGALALQYEPFRERVLGEEGRATSGAGPVVSVQGEGTSAELVVGGVPLSGRGLIWLRTFRHALEAPVLGHGTGSSVQFLATEVAVGVVHPHNEYLRIFHDLGAVGVLVFIAAAWMIAARLLRLHRRAADRRYREAALAAGLAFAGYLGILVFDNALLYPASLTQNLFLLLVLAEPGSRAADAAAEAAA